MSNVIICFSEIPKILICARVRQVVFLSENWKKLSVWSSVLFTDFALEMREKEAYRDMLFLLHKIWPFSLNDFILFLCLFCIFQIKNFSG